MATTTPIRQREQLATGRPYTRAEIYSRLSVAIKGGEKARARRIYYDEIIPDRRFTRGEYSRLSYQLGAIDEGDRYLAEERTDL